MSAPADRGGERGEEACLSFTRGLCNVCGRLTGAKVVARGGRVYLQKGCPEHGLTEGLVSSDADWTLRSGGYVKPGTIPLARSVEKYTGCPASCGLCPEHEQHTCVPILEITDRCDLRCPACLVAGRSAWGTGDLSLDEARRALETVLRCEGRVNMLTLSGGEPTLHPDLLAIVELARRPEVGIVSVSTNGLRLLEDEPLARGLVERGVVISLQFDGFGEGAGRELRDRPGLGEVKRRIVDKLLAMGARLSLTVTLARGVNEGALGEALALLFGSDQVLSVMVQPVAHAGRAARDLPWDPLEVLTVPDVVRLLAASSGGVLEARDFTPLPCSHPTCFALTYLLRTEEGRLVPLPRVLEAADYLDIIKNQALLGTDLETLEKVRSSLYALWSSDGLIPDRDAVLRTAKRILVDLNRLGRGSACQREVVELGAKNVKSIFIHHFMDRATFDLSRVVKCCNHYPTPDGRLLPACVRNNLDPSLVPALASMRVPRNQRD
jgi:7,8-dihydro-6-hydroxymethylpterin dimethyltransferase